MTLLIFSAFLTLLIAVCFLIFTLRGDDHSAFDVPDWPVIRRDQISEEHQHAVEKVLAEQAELAPLRFSARLAELRKRADQRRAALMHNAHICPVDRDGITGDWVIAPGANPRKRMLYIHGGAYMAGSALSHRGIAIRMSESSGAAVFVPNYRLLPEHRRRDGLEDCRKAWAYISENGPETAETAKKLYLAGDSSGGNLALSLMLWLRDQARRQADAVIALSPQTDLTLRSPSLRRNANSDVMQGKSFGPIVRCPLLLRLIFSLMMHRTRPDNPYFSPLHGDLSGLPPVLIQTSDCDMFLDDCRRFINKMNAHGSVGQLEIWHELLHVWQAFDIPEADDAFAQMQRFLHKAA